jgi:outer membrane protein OmpA-like peptidoglycan-associated protein
MTLEQSDALEQPDAKTSAPSDPRTNGPEAASEFSALRRLLVGPEQRGLRELSARVEKLAITPEELAEHLPAAVALRTSRDRQLGRALAPTMQTAIRESVRRNPREIATAIFPVLGPAIRKAIAEALAAMVRSINSAVEHSLSLQGLRWRIEAWRTGVPYGEIVLKHALVYRVEQVFLIHAETGLLLAHVTAQGLKVPEADLISSMLTAIQDFVRDSFRPGEGATLRTFSVGDHTVQVEAGPAALLAAVIRGQAPASFTTRLQQTLETVHLEYAAPLAEFTGDASGFESAGPLLAECLETALTTHRSGERRQRVWLRWVVPLAALALVLAGLGIRSRLRWDRALRALQAEPGLVVVEADRSWGEWRFSGLRDPVARDPAVVLAGSGLLPGNLSGRWEPYLSLDSAMILERARRSLSVPASVSLSLRGDTLVFGGSGPLDWLARIRGAGVPPGVSRWDLTAIQPVLPPGLDSLKRAIESGRILFEPGSFRLSAAAEAQVSRDAGWWRRLADELALLGTSARLRVVGRTDPTGSAETNQALSQWRVDQVVRQLARAGVAPALLVADAVATSRPLPGPDSLERARINRSVSFEVVVDGGPEGQRRR